MRRQHGAGSSIGSPCGPGVHRCRAVHPRLEKRLLGGDQRTFQFQKLGFEEDGINAACVERNGVRCCFQSVSIMALFLSEQSGFEGPCLSALTVERQAPLVGLKRQFILALRFQKLSVLKPISGTTRIFLERLEDGFNGFRTSPCTGAKARQQRAIRSGVNPQRFKSANGSLSVLVAHVHQEVGVGAKQFWIVWGEFHPCLEPVAVKGVVAPESSDVFQALEHALVTGESW